MLPWRLFNTSAPVPPKSPVPTEATTAAPVPSSRRGGLLTRRQQIVVLQHKRPRSNRPERLSHVIKYCRAWWSVRRVKWCRRFRGCDLGHSPNHSQAFTISRRVVALGCSEGLGCIGDCVLLALVHLGEHALQRAASQSRI